MSIKRLIALAIALLPAGAMAQSAPRAALAANPAATNDLGLKYERGDGVPVDYAKARQLYAQAAQSGYGLAYSNLGNLVAQGHGGPADLVQAARYYAQGARLGNALAQNSLGLAYQYGRGVPRDISLAIRYFQMAAQGGNASAQTNLGFIYQTGDGVPHDYAIALRYYLQAADAGNATAKNNLGNLYEHGLGVSIDYPLAFKYYSESAQAGNARGQTSLGYLYHAGLGVARDDSLAFRYYSMAAQTGLPQAVNNLGYMYDSGDGVPRDAALAFKYYSQAAQAGLPQAQNNLGQLYKTGRGVPKDIARAMELFQTAAQNGYAAAYFNLGLVFRDGLDGIQADPERANDAFKKAVDLGYSKAASFIIKPRLASAPPPQDRSMVAFDPPAPVARAAPVKLTGATVPVGRRLALVIANGDYAPNLNNLKNPINDAKLMAAALAKAGFTVTPRFNLTTIQMKDAVANFVEALNRAGPNATALFYYAGHGAAAQGVNYLVPVGQAINSQTALQTYGQNAEDIVDLLSQAKPTTTIVILDACRNVAFGNSRGSGGGLVQMDAHNGAIIAYATAPGHVAADGDGDDSPYSAALAALIAQSDEPVEIVFRRVRAKVVEQTQNEQTPWESTSLVSDFAFRPK